MNASPDTTRRASRAASAALLVAVGSAGGFVVAYWRDGPIQLLGTFLAGALAGVGAALGFIAQRLLPSDEAVEEWSPTATGERERRAMVAELTKRGLPIRRRSLLVGLLGGAVAALGGALLVPLRSLGPRPARTLFHTAWSPGARLVTDDGAPVHIDDLAVGGFVTVWPDGHVDAADSHAVLIRTRLDDVRPRPGREGWTPAGYVAYSKTCTHAGCPVGLYDQVTQHLFCPCEQAVFDVSDAARPVAGPAPRSLPQLPLEVDGEGFLRARGDFPEPVGPGFWERGA